MSTSGFFDSDAAIDWLLELEDTGLVLVEETLLVAVRAERLAVGDVDRGAVALATLAHWIGRPAPGTDLTQDLERWLRLTTDRPEESLLDLARLAADRLLEGDVERHESMLRDLRDRLRAD